jgi:hypothetical protein
MPLPETEHGTVTKNLCKKIASTIFFLFPILSCKEKFRQPLSARNLTKYLFPSNKIFFLAVYTLLDNVTFEVPVSGYLLSGIELRHLSCLLVFFLLAK